MGAKKRKVKETLAGACASFGAEPKETIHLQSFTGIKRLVRFL